MKLISIYRLFVGTETKFLDRYPKDTQDIAQTFWNDLNSACLFFLILLFGVSILFCAFYFTAWNNMPRRHYRPSHWIGAYIITFLVVFFCTVALGYMLTNTSLNGSASLIWDIAFGNAVYSFIIFGLLSIAWFLWLPTNAYRLIGKK